MAEEITSASKIDALAKEEAFRYPSTIAILHNSRRYIETREVNIEDENEDWTQTSIQKRQSITKSL